LISVPQEAQEGQILFASLTFVMQPAAGQFSFSTHANQLQSVPEVPKTEKVNFFEAIATLFEI
jgi:hypothetical protein